MISKHKNKFNSFSIKGDIKKFNDQYILKDNTTLNNLVVSSTLLYRNQSTNGHYHKGQEEVYFFLSGIGQMELGKDKFNISAGDVVLIEDGIFHRVHNTADTDLYFVCVFDGKRNH
jgi:mannose-6-phosphate isomerase-like protein (cupin superfamily)